MKPVVALFALVFTGALVGFVVALPPGLGLSVVGGAMLVAWRLPRAPRTLLLLLSAFAVGASAAALAASRYEADVAQLPIGERVVVEGLVADVSDTRAGGRRLELRASGLLWEQTARPASANVQVSLPARLHRLVVRPGDRVRVRGRLRAFDPADFPGQFDSARFGLARNRHARLTVWQADDAMVVEPGAEMALFAQTRLALRRQLMGLLTPTEAGVVLALLIGDTSLFDEEQLELYRRVGAGHLLAVSGLQVSLLALVLVRAGLWVLLCIPAVAARGLARRGAALLAVIGVWCFIGLCGAPPSAVRAAAMSTAMLSAESLSAPRLRGLDALGVAGLCTVLVHPPVVLDPSFLLSYAAVVGLFAGVTPSARDAEETRTHSSWQRHRAAFLRAALATLGAGAFTLPISAHLFGEVSPGGVLAN
ncbi:MAG: ComEC/Rec2 family competence protein, partial [Myxococcota bacterium]